MLNSSTYFALALTSSQRGILDKYGIELIGAKLPSIDRAEDRELFKQSMIRIGQKVPASGEDQAEIARVRQGCSYALSLKDPSIHQTSVVPLISAISTCTLYYVPMHDLWDTLGFM